MPDQHFACLLQGVDPKHRPAGISYDRCVDTRDDTVRDYAYHVAQDAAACEGERARLLNLFCSNICVHPWQGYLVIRRDDDVLYCFRRKTDAKHFQTQFGGVLKRTKRQTRLPGLV